MTPKQRLNILWLSGTHFIHTNAAYSTNKQLFSAVPHTAGRGGCGLMAATDWTLREEVNHKQSPLWQFPDVSQRSTWLADDSPGRCGHFLDSSTLFLHRLCSETHRETGWATSAEIMQEWAGHSSNYHTVQSQKPWSQHELMLISQQQLVFNNIIFTVS